MFRNEFVGIFSRDLKSGEVFPGADVTEGSAQVAEEGGALDAADGALAEKGQEGGVSER